MTNETKALIQSIPKAITNGAYKPSLQVKNDMVKRLLRLAIRESLLTYCIKDNLLFITLNQSRGVIVVNHVKQMSLKRFLLNGPVYLITNNEISELNDVDHVLQLIQLELQGTIEIKQWQQFVAEIQNNLVNATLTARHMMNVNRQLAAAMTEARAETLYDYIMTACDLTQRDIFFEQWAARGHPDHPCHKTKFGLTPQEVLQYSPEFKQPVSIQLAALLDRCVHIESLEAHFNYRQWFANEFPLQWKLFHEKMHDDGLDQSQYIPFFVHPWQAQKQLNNLFHDLLKDKTLLIFNDVTLSVQPCMSFRTMIPKGSAYRPHIKLPVAVQATSAIRTVSPASVQNGPKISGIVNDILLKENHFNNTLFISAEIAGLHVLGYESDVAKNLSVIYRENSLKKLSNRQMPIVVAALFELTPHKQQPFLVEMIHAAVGDSLSAASQYFASYSKIVIDCYLGLFLLYGVALEGHQQNTVMVFEDKLPRFCVARDFGGIRIDLDVLSEQGYDYQSFPGSVTTAGEVIEVTNRFIHTVMQYHLGEIVCMLSHAYQVDESHFWQLIKNNVIDCFDKLRNRISPERFSREYQAILQADWQVKGLMRMRLNDASHHYINIQVANPLRDLCT